MHGYLEGQTYKDMHSEVYFSIVWQKKSSGFVILYTQEVANKTSWLLNLLIALPPVTKKETMHPIYLLWLNTGKWQCYVLGLSSIYYNIHTKYTSQVKQYHEAMCTE